MIEMSFDFEETVYLFELRTEWYNELNVILEELDLQSGIDGDDQRRRSARRVLFKELNRSSSVPCRWLLPQIDSSDVASLRAS